MKQLDYLERIAERTTEFMADYAEEAARLEDSGIGDRKVKRQLDIWTANWHKNNPLFANEEFETLSGVARGDDDAINKLGIGGEGAGIAQGFNVNDSIQQYKQIQAAKEITGGTAATQQKINVSSEDLARQIMMDPRNEFTFEERKQKIQEMLDGGLAVPDYILQNYGLTK